MGVFGQKRHFGDQELPFDSPRLRMDSIGYLPGILTSDQMKRTLSKERRRTDRSGTPFLLMLLDAERAGQLDETGTLTQRVCSCLLTCLRETDVCGQYAAPSVLGILFTEVNSDSADPIEVVIRSRVVAALSSQLDENEMNRLRITTHLYPDKWDRLDKDERPSTPELYRDLPDQMQDRKVQHALKRTIDVIGSAAALLVLSPLMFVVAALTRLTSKGPILFKQRRLGQYGEPFVLLKFRTMHHASDSAIHKAFVSQFIKGGGLGDQTPQRNQEAYKITKDPRVTRLGRLLRESSLDELPQFWNVLMGDMSLVGPRPPIPYEVDNYNAWHRRRLLEVKPGITGLWQVYGRSRTKFDDMVRLDLQYARTWTVWLDLKILFRTPLAVISGNGAH